MQVDRESVVNALISCEVGASAREEASRLVDAYLGKLETFPEVNWRCLFVEGLFYIQVQPKTWIVGVMDAGFRDESGIVTAEWKTRRPPKVKKDGTNYEGDDEAGWLAEISQGPQLGTYALAAREGKFPAKEVMYGVQEPRILVRAAIKSSPVQIWPKDYKSGLFSFSPRYLDTVRDAYISEAEGIRARRRAGVVPFGLPGTRCTNMYRRVCEFLKDCQERVYPPLEPVGFWHPENTAPDPGLRVTEALGLDPKDPETVVLSASAMEAYSWCSERGRRLYGGHAKGESSFELECGLAYHAALKNIYGQQISSGQPLDHTVESKLSEER